MTKTVTPQQIKWFGWRRDRIDHRDKHFRPKIAPSRLPAAVDLREHCPPHMDQLALGSCVANGTTGIARYTLMKEGYADIAYSRLQVYYDGRVIEGGVNEDTGLEVRDGLKVLASKGMAPEALWPYNISKFTQKPFPRVYERALQFKALEYRRVEPTADAIKAAIAEGYPVVGGYNVYEQFDSSEAEKTGTIELPGLHEAAIGGHCTYFCGFGQRTGRITSRNSWGNDWGDKGDMYFPERYLEDYGSDYWIITKAAWGKWVRPAVAA